MPVHVFLTKGTHNYTILKVCGTQDLLTLNSNTSGIKEKDTSYDQT